MVPAVCFLLARSACSGEQERLLGEGWENRSSEIKLFALRY